MEPWEERIGGVLCSYERERAEQSAEQHGDVCGDAEIDFFDPYLYRRMFLIKLIDVSINSFEII